jgi:hypothetical protein
VLSEHLLVRRAVDAERLDRAVVVDDDVAVLPLISGNRSAMIWSERTVAASMSSSLMRSKKRSIT